MSLNCTVGGAKGMFESRFACEIAGLLDAAFGAEGDWEGTDPVPFGALEAEAWADLQRRAARELGSEEVPNLMALGTEGKGVYLPANVCAMTLPLSAGDLRCASLPGLRRELTELASRWELPVEDEGLEAILQVASDPDDGFVADAPEVLTFARIALAANEAVRRDCPLWLFV